MISLTIYVLIALLVLQSSALTYLNSSTVATLSSVEATDSSSSTSSSNTNHLTILSSDSSAPETVSPQLSSQRSSISSLAPPDDGHVTESSTGSEETSAMTQPHQPNPTTTHNQSNLTTITPSSSPPITKNAQIGSNATITSPATLPTLLTYGTLDPEHNTTRTVTECPIFYDSSFASFVKDPTCCSYYNASGNVGAFKDWMTAGAGGDQPDIGAKYGCCGQCTVIGSAQLYYWPSVPQLILCPEIQYFVTETISIDSTDSIYYTEPFSISESYVDPAVGCNGTNTAPVTTVINDFTITSPTPAIGFSAIRAFDHCTKAWEKTALMSAIPYAISTYVGLTTMTYDSGDVTVFPAYAQINFSDYESCTENCAPILDPYNGFDPSWQGANDCRKPEIGFPDPPIALVRQSGLGNGVGHKSPPPAPGPTPASVQKPTPAVADPGSGKDKGNSNTQGDKPAATQQPENGMAGLGAIIQGDHLPNDNSPDRPPPSQPYPAPKNDVQPNDPAPQPAPSPQNSAPAPTTPPLPPAGASPAPVPVSAHLNPAPALTLGSETFTPNANSQYNISPSLTLSPGGPAITHSGHIYSLDPSATALAIDSSSTQILPGQPAPPVQTTGPEHGIDRPGPITVAPNVILTPDLTENGNGNGMFIVGSKTLVPGGEAVIVDGSSVSLVPGGTAVWVNGISYPLTAEGPTVATADARSGGGSQSEEAWLGQYIWQGLGGSTTTASSATVGPKEQQATASRSTSRGTTANSLSPSTSSKDTSRNRNLGSHTSTTEAAVATGGNLNQGGKKISGAGSRVRITFPLFGWRYPSAVCMMSLLMPSLF